MVIDAHAHIIVPEIGIHAAPEESWRPKVYWENGHQVIEFGGKRLTSATRNIVDIETILEEQRVVGVDLVLLCPFVPLLRYDAGPQDTMRSAARQNEALSRLAQKYPDGMRALGTVPLQEPALAARELGRIMEMPGIVGVEVAANVRGEYLGADTFAPFWEAAEALGALVFIHPTNRGFDLPVFQEYYLWNSIGNPTETAIAAGHLILTGVMENHPRLKVLLAHGGGAILGLRGRLRHSHRHVQQSRVRLKEAPDDSLRRFYFDTITHDGPLLKALIDFAGADHVLLGSDYPFVMGDPRPTERPGALGLPLEEQAAILGGNAARLIGLES